MMGKLVIAMYRLRPIQQVTIHSVKTPQSSNGCEAKRRVDNAFGALFLVLRFYMQSKNVNVVRTLNGCLGSCLHAYLYLNIGFQFT